jgi:hypothetical protein
MYNRLFTKILDSSIWLEADTTRLVWITLLAAMDEDGFAPFSSVENLSHRANIPLNATVTAVTILESPDKFNPNDEFEGRRIERMENGWLVLKAPLYRSLLTREIQREQTRLRVAKHREKKKAVTKSALPNVTAVTCNTSEHSKAKHSKAEEIYRAFPLKVGKPAALRAIAKALSKTSFDNLLAKTKAFAEARNGDMEFCPHPATWFNGERYNDDPSTWIRADSGPKKIPDPNQERRDAEYERAQREWAEKKKTYGK